MRELKSALFLAVSLFRQDMKERFAGSLLGSLWMFLWPLIQLFIYIVIFGKLMGGRFSGEAQMYSYGAYVASGLIVWTCFANALMRTSRIFLEKRHIISKVRVSFWVFPASACMIELLPFSVSMALLTCIDFFWGWRPDLTLTLYALFALHCFLLMAVGAGMLCAVFSVFARDAIEALAVLLQMGFWFTPVVYVPSILPDWVRELLSINPLTHVVAAFQNLFVFGHPPSLGACLYILCVGHGLFWTAVWIVRKLEKDVRDVL